MSDTPTTAEEAEYAVYDRFGLIRDQMSRATAVDQLRFLEEKYPNDGPHRICRLVECDENGAPTPDALADLNGGEWVQPKDAAGKVPVWFQKFRDAWPEKRKPSEIGRTQPLFIFVPREATDGND